MHHLNRIVRKPSILHFDKELVVVNGPELGQADTPEFWDNVTLDPSRIHIKGCWCFKNFSAGLPRLVQADQASVKILQ